MPFQWLEFGCMADWLAFAAAPGYHERRKEVLWLDVGRDSLT